MPARIRLRELTPQERHDLEALAQGYFRLGQYGAALQALDQWREREPLHPAAHYWRGRVFQEMERSGEALPAYRRAVEIDPGYANPSDRWP